MTDHERQFVYLPLEILKNATNIRDLLQDKMKGKEKHFNFLAEEIHKQLARKRWAPELKELRFVIEEEGEDDAETSENEPEKDDFTNKNEPIVVRNEEPIPSTSRAPQIIRTPGKEAKTTPAINNSRMFRKRTVHSFVLSTFVDI